MEYMTPFFVFTQFLVVTEIYWGLFKFIVWNTSLNFLLKYIFNIIVNFEFIGWMLIQNLQYDNL